MPVTILSAHDLEKSFGAELIFSNVTFQIQDRDRVALVGPNGAGKSTLMRILAGLEHPDHGRVVTRSGLRITYQAQETRFKPSRTVRETALDAFADLQQIARDLAAIEQSMAEATDAQLEALFTRYAELSAQFESGGGYEIDHRTDEVLSGLGFDESDYGVMVEYLSGGQKTRLALATALLADPDLLLLDEPTNHLDLAALEWLEGFMRNWNRAFLVISHDRYFLDRVTERTLELSSQTLEDYPAAYSRFLKLREERIARRIAEYEAQQEYIARTEEFIRRYKAGQRAKEARGRETRLARMERLEKPEDETPLHLRFGSGGRSGRIVFRSTELEVGYPPSRGESEPTHLLDTPELQIERGDRVALIGPNGTGKTSLVRTILGEIKPLKGRVEFGTNVKPAYYAQGHEGLVFNRTALQTLLDAQPMSEEAARTLLGRFLFSGDDVYKKVSALSGGERSRLALARLTLERANFLILDEPTNHLDISSRESLEIVLDDYEGTILFVSHDRYLIDRIATKLWTIDDGRLTEHLGNYTDLQRRQQPAAAPPSRNGKDRADGHKPPVTRRPSDREIRRLQQDLAATERAISKLEEQLNALSDELARATHEQDVEEIASLGEDYENAQSELEACYARWEELGAQIHAATEAIRS